jgi:hypothetical protein
MESDINIDEINMSSIIKDENKRITKTIASIMKTKLHHLKHLLIFIVNIEIININYELYIKSTSNI